MRYLIAAAAFVAPVLLAVAVGGTLASGDAIKPRISGAALGELRAYAAERDGLLERYACDPGTVETRIPHLALERFDRRGCDPGGQPWYRLGNQPVPCGLLRRATGGPEGAPGTGTVDGAPPTLVLSLTPRWSYWERTPRPPPTSP